MAEVVSLGILVADAFGKPIDKFPDEDRLVVFEKMELHIGGCAANTGVALVRLGTQVKVVGKVGADGFGDFIINTLTNNGVDASSVIKDPSVGTSFTFIAISSVGKRRFFHSPEANSSFSISDIDFSVLKGAKLLHVAGSGLMAKFDGDQTAELLKEAKKQGLITSLDTAYNDRITDAGKLIYPSLPYLDYFLPSIEEAEKITRISDPIKIARELKQMCPGVVGIKLGPEGFLLKTDAIEKLIPPYQVEVVDTSGAGDCFMAGFLRGVLEGWDMERCALFGSATAAFCIHAIGCTTGVRSFTETLAFVKRMDS